MEKEDWSRILRAAGLLSYLGIIMVVSISLGYFIGTWLDGLLGTEPWLMVAGLLLGIASGFYGVYQIIRGAMLDE